MKKISFSHNWNNKLSDPQKIFSTIRRSVGDKKEYYKKSVGDIFRVVLGDDDRGKAKLIHVDEVQFRKIPFPILMLDTGLSKPSEIRDLFENYGITLDDYALILIFERQEEIEEDDIPF